MPARAMPARSRGSRRSAAAAAAAGPSRTIAAMCDVMAGSKARVGSASAAFSAFGSSAAELRAASARAAAAGVSPRSAAMRESRRRASATSAEEGSGFLKISGFPLFAAGLSRRPRAALGAFGCYSPRWARGGASRGPASRRASSSSTSPGRADRRSVPQGPGAADRIALAPPVLTAKVENSRASVWLPQVGHDGDSAPRTSVSNRCSHPSQRYSVNRHPSIIAAPIRSTAAPRPRPRARRRVATGSPGPRAVWGALVERDRDALGLEHGLDHEHRAVVAFVDEGGNREAGHVLPIGLELSRRQSRRVPQPHVRCRRAAKRAE